MRAFLLALLLVGCGGNDDDRKTTEPVDCAAHPEQCK